MNTTPFVLTFVAACAALGAFGLSRNPPPPPPPALLAPASPPTAWPDFSPRAAAFRQPAGPDGPAIAYGHELLTRTFALIGPEVPDPSKRYAGNNLSCQNCHLDAGTNRQGLPLVGIFRSYPRQLPDGKGEQSLADRLNQCMTHSMNGRPLPIDSWEMTSMVAYVRYLGDPPPQPPQPRVPAPPLAPNAERGSVVFETVCSACHQSNGLGKRIGSSTQAMGYAFPPLWGPDSFNDAAGMDWVPQMARFVLHNMPRGVDPEHPVLTPQQAWDVSTYVLAQPRPHYTRQ